MDMLSWLDTYRQYTETGGVAAYAFSFFHEHRLVWVRGLTALDASVFRSSGLAFVAAASVALAGVAVLLTLEFVRSVPAKGPRWALVLLCPMLILTAGNAVDCSVPVNCVYPLTVLFVVAACVLFDGAGETRRWCALVMAGGAGFANALGLLAWPVLLWVAWRGRAGWRWMCVVAAVGTVYSLAYLSGVASTGGVAPVSTVGHLIKLLAYMVAYLGLPVSRVAPVPGTVFGAVVLAGSVLAVVWCTVARSVTRLERIATGLILFSLGGAALAAVGRSHFTSVIELPVRYTMLVTPLHVGLLALVLPPAMRAFDPRPGVLMGGGLAVAVGLLGQQVLGGRSAIAAADTMRATLVRYYAGAHDAQIQQLVFPDLNEADAIVSRLRGAGMLGD